MTERLLQYIWQFQYYNKNELTTTDGEEMKVIHPGQFNTHQGPDFIGGRIRLGVHTWVGSIELHINASDWRRHSHDEDPNYDNVILHVVWNDDEKRVQKFPTLVIGDRVPKVLLQQYDTWMKGDQFIPCASSIECADDITWIKWKERLMTERLERKSEQVMAFLRRNNFHWEEMLWWMTARNFGLYVNADAFGEMAASIPFNLLSKHRMQIHQLEALMFGQAGLLDGDFSEKYPLMLKKEYAFLRVKYELQKIHVPVHFLRMRPACFPTVRMAQLAMLIHETENIFSSIIGSSSLKDIRKILQITANDYWHYHFRFDEETVYKPKVLGAAMIDNILMNTVITVLFTYGKYHNEIMFCQRAMDWMSELPAEQNAMIKMFRNLGVQARSALDSQSLIELKSQYCDHRRCLDCSIASAVLRGRGLT